MSKRDDENRDLSNRKAYIEALKILTPREAEILKGVAMGRTSREIGEDLYISYRTVQKYRQNICKKLKLKGYRGLFYWCYEHLLNGEDHEGS